jgi:transposase
VSSYSEQNEYVRWGYNRDNEKLPQINLGLLYGQDSKLPAYYRKLPGSISDVSTLKTTVSSLGFIGQSTLTFILDRGFYSQANIDALFEAKYNFIIAAPRRKWVEKLYDECRGDIVSSKNRYAVKENEVLYMVTKLYSWNGRRCYAHIYFNNKKAAEETDAFTLKLMAWKNELESGAEKAGNKWAYEKYFHVKETPKRGKKVLENTEAIQAAINVYSGFSCIITTKKMGAAEALEIYRRKETVENGFDDLKNALDMKRLRIHSSASMESRLFIQFVALILLSAVRNIKNQNDKLRGMTIREIMEAMETVSEIRFSGRYGKIITEIDPIQRNIMEAFSVTLNIA